MLRSEPTAIFHTIGSSRFAAKPTTIARRDGGVVDDHARRLGARLRRLSRDVVQRGGRDLGERRDVVQQGDQSETQRRPPFGRSGASIGEMGRGRKQARDMPVPD